MVSDASLYRRGAATLLASWEAYARVAAGATVRRRPGVTAAVFPHEPERAIFNNALLDRQLSVSDRPRAITAMETAYAQGGVARFAAWVHESDDAMRRDLEQRGYALDETTRAMGMVLDEIRLPRPELELALADWSEHLRIGGLPANLLSGVDAATFHVLVARLQGQGVATAIAFDLDDDCGIYNVGTLEHARRRGLGTALSAMQLHNALARGRRTASVQSTAMAERVYAAVGFRDLGRILEYIPIERGAPGPLHSKLGS